MPRMILSLLRRRPCFQAPWGGAVVTPHLWPLRSYLELGALPTAVPCARLHARHLVWEWGLNGLAARATTRESSSKSGTPTRSRQHPKISAKMALPTLKKREGAGCS